MPYIKIMEEDINPLASFDTIENAVLVFGLDYRHCLTPGEKSESYEQIKDFRLFTSLRDFYSYIVQNHQGILTDTTTTGNRLNTPGYRSFVATYDYLASGLPVILFPLDDYLPDEAIIELETYNSDTQEWEKNGTKVILYEYLSDPKSVPDNKPDSLRDLLSDESWTDARDIYRGTELNQDFVRDAILAAITATSGDSEGAVYTVRLGDRVSMPFSFITTCGFDSVDVCTNIISACQTTVISGTESGDLRQDFLYLYDIGAEYTPAQVVTNKSNAISSAPAWSSNVAMIYPWATYTTNVRAGVVHMPGSYGYLMAYANSIKTNKPWLAIAGINRGYIPNIVKTDYDVSEPYVHAMQGDTITNINCRVNPIVNFGQNMGTIIFGNRTNFVPSNNVISFKSFLNVRLLLIFLQKQAYVASVQHMFEPNDDIVWLSFKQRVNELLEQMVSGRGIKWYKWFKLQPDKLGQIKARILIRPIEAVEAFEITISMTDADIAVSVQEG